MSGSVRVCDGSRARSKRSSSSAASGSTGAIWSSTNTRPPGAVTRASSATAYSGCAMWCSVRREHARSKEPASNERLVASPSTKVTFAGAPRRARSSSSGNAGVSFGQDAVTQQHHGRSDRKLTIELHGERVHRHRSDDRPWLACHTYFGSGQVTPEAVAVAHRHQADPGRSLGDEAASVAR